MLNQFCPAKSKMLLQFLENLLELVQTPTVRKTLLQQSVPVLTWGLLNYVQPFLCLKALAALCYMKPKFALLYVILIGLGLPTDETQNAMWLVWGYVSLMYIQLVLPFWVTCNHFPQFSPQNLFSRPCATLAVFFLIDSAHYVNHLKSSFSEDLVLSVQKDTAYSYMSSICLVFNNPGN